MQTHQKPRFLVAFEKSESLTIVTVFVDTFLLLAGMYLINGYLFHELETVANSIKATEAPLSECVDPVTTYCGFLLASVATLLYYIASWFKPSE